MFVELLTIGDELCRGEIVNTNASWLAAQLWDLDLTVRWMTSCRDDAADMTQALRAAAGRADLVLTSGGLGPTEDDLTVDVVAAAAGQGVVVDEPSRLRLEERFPGRAAQVPNLLRQLRVPAAARVHGNPVGLAPCFELDLPGATGRPVPVLCLPGVPREIHGIFDGGVRARLVELREGQGVAPRIARRIYRVFGRGESQIAVACAGVVDDQPGASIHYQVKFPETLVKIVVRDRELAAAAARLEVIDGRLRAALGEFLYGTDEPALPEVVVGELLGAGLTVACAESCTGGMVGELLTRRPGASRAFRGGAIVYSNEEKSRQLGISPALLADHGAVSEACVRAMASATQDRFDVDVAVAISGIAGPDGGSADKPVGTVWLATATRAGQVNAQRIHWPGARDMVRTLAAWWALTLVRQAAGTMAPAGGGV